MAGREVFVDTSALYAFVNSRDEHHTRAAQVVTKAVKAGRSLVVSDYVITEAVNLAQVRGGKFVSSRVLDLLDQSVAIRVEWISPERFELARAFFRKHADHGYSFTDCTSFILMRELHIQEVLTTDRHFTEAGFRSLLSTVQ
ncbi:MAG: type II toxin-antitoxin system VapC family toxin [Methylacidiphilales bacterium]|nr:type II toxin-antitoxin system VapC family toxin [Candidatus Methylacidiphilales bacterium]